MNNNVEFFYVTIVYKEDFMSFIDLNLEPYYDSEENDLINDFYIPVLSNSKEYLRLVGYFNSGTLSLVSKGLKDFILHNGKMKLVCSYDLDEADIKAIYDASYSLKDVISKNFIKELEKLSKNKDSVYFNNIQILGWMVAHDMLEIKIAVKLDDYGNITSDGILHAKVAVLEDFEGNKISFTGSNNETSAALKNNFEQFDVFNSWKEESRVKKHLDTFNKYWNETINSYEVMSVPEAVERKLISYAPKKYDDLKFDDEKKENKKPDLFSYQIKARESWFKNNRRGIFAMATGTGKTYTSFGCLEKVLELENKLITVIAVPYIHLVQQWKNSLEQYGLMDKIDTLIIADTSNYKWKQDLANAIYEVDFNIISNAVVITTHKTLSGEKFRSLISEDGLTSKLLLIADEMHGLGSYKYREGLLECYDYRLGLSATPERVFDDVGTDILMSFFNDIVYTFSLEEALKTINPITGKTYLTPYNYYPCFVNVSTEELNTYKELTDKIIKIKHSKNNDQQEDSLEKRYRERADIIKNAINKYDVLRSLLNDLGKDVKDLIIYCSPQQIDEVINIAGNEFGLNVRKFTNEESAKVEKKWGNKSERDVILESFSEGSHQCLVAMKCLDEGVDIPSATNAILMCSSTNPREFIQRIGRVIRRYPGKNEANIYDLMVKPRQVYNDNLKAIEDQIYNKELERSEKIVKLAKNNAIKYKLYD